jgi:hypothetical protein
MRDLWWTVTRCFCPNITILLKFNTHHPHHHDPVLWNHLKPHPSVFIITCLVSCNSLPFKQACKMSASCSPFPVRKLYSAAVCFVTLHALSSPRPVILSNATTLLSPVFVGLAANQLFDWVPNAIITARAAFPLRSSRRQPIGARPSGFFFYLM